MAKAVLVIDMLRGFLEEGYPLYIGEGARGIIPNIQRLLEQELAQGSKVFFICDNHDPDDLEFKMFPAHCVAGTVVQIENLLGVVAEDDVEVAVAIQIAQRQVRGPVRSCAERV